jgi:hypothetical protein
VSVSVFFFGGGMEGARGVECRGAGVGRSDLTVDSDSWETWGCCDGLPCGGLPCGGLPCGGLPCDGLPCGAGQGHTWGAAGTATPLTERRKEKINGWLAAAETSGAGKAGSTSGRCVTG